MDLINVSDMTLIFSFYLGLFGLMLSIKVIGSFIIKSSKGIK